jgi:hypothetical protein
MSPTARTLKLLREEGWTAQVVERWNAYATIRVDLFGGIDIVAIHPVRGILGVQACAVSSQSARMAKLLAEPKLREWVAAGGRLEVWGWGKRKVKRGGTATRWEVTRREVTWP